MAQHQKPKSDWHFELEDKDLERFFLKVGFPNEKDCMEWQATRQRQGYGKLRLKGESRETHRIAYVSFVGPTDGSLVLHKCNNTSCVNIEHLYLGDHTQNLNDLIQNNKNTMDRNQKFYKSASCKCGCKFRYKSNRVCVECGRSRQRIFMAKKKTQQLLAE